MNPFAVLGLLLVSILIPWQPGAAMGGFIDQIQERLEGMEAKVEMQQEGLDP